MRWLLSIQLRSYISSSQQDFFVSKLLITRSWYSGVQLRRKLVNKYYINKVRLSQDYLPQWHRKVFKDTGDKSSYVLNLVGTPFKKEHFKGSVPKHGWDMSSCPHMFRHPCTIKLLAPLLTLTINLKWLF